MSGITILLPHGYEGQGPEHSSARIERYLQMAAEDNIQVVNCTTPANYFHVLRRQMLRKFRKPLIIFTPKSLLRNKEAVSKLVDMGDETRFKKIIVDGNNKEIKKVVFCSGKIFYDIKGKINNEQSSSIMIIRIEQLYPFPMENLVEIIKDCKNAAFFWCQEEPKNMGPWSFVHPLLVKLLNISNFKTQNIEYIGREDSASTATGLFKKHVEEQSKIIESLLNYKL